MSFQLIVKNTLIGYLTILRMYALPDADGFDGGPDVMDAQEAGADFEGNRVEDGSARECFFGRGVEETPDHRLAGDTDQNGIVREGAHEVREAAHENVVLFQRLAEAESRVEDNVGDAKVIEALEVGCPLAGDGSGKGIIAEGSGIDWRVVRQYVWHAQVGNGWEHRLVLQAAGDVVDDVGTEVLDTASCHLRAESVDADDGMGMVATDDG